MIFIFGVSPNEKDFGPCQELHCDHCNNTRFWHLIRSRQMFSFFFIPIIPLATKYMLVCPICHSGKTVQQNEFEQLRDLATLNREAVDGAFSEKEYTERKNSL